MFCGGYLSACGAATYLQFVGKTERHNCFQNIGVSLGGALLRDSFARLLLALYSLASRMLISLTR